jgi:hypothetical protein
MEIIGQCRLCLKHGPLKDSHFISQAAYKRVRGKGKNPHPLIIQADKAIQTSDQTRAHVLYGECEQRFSKNGAGAFFRNYYRGPGKFRLLEILTDQTALSEDDQIAVYAVPEFTKPGRKIVPLAKEAESGYRSLVSSTFEGADCTSEVDTNLIATHLLCYISMYNKTDHA